MKELENDFINFTSTVFGNLGLDSLGSSIVGIVFLEPEPVPMEELAKRTGYSLASLSNKLKLLEAQQLIKKTRKPGSKKSFYYIEKDVYQIMHRKMKAMKELFMAPAHEILPDLIDKYKGKKLAGEDRKKFDIVQNYYRQIKEVEQCMDRMIADMEKR